MSGEHFAGLDVSVATTAVCVVDAAGEVVFRGEAATDPEAIAEVLAPWAATLRRAGHEAGSLSPWLQPGLRRLGVPAVCLETRHVRAAMSAQRNKMVCPGGRRERRRERRSPRAGRTSHAFLRTGRIAA